MSDESDRRFSFRDHPWKFALASPCVAAAVTFAVVAAWGHGLLPRGVPDEFVIATILADGVVAVAGAAAGGLLTRDTPGHRIFMAFVFGGLGFVAYCTFLCGAMWSVPSGG